jgi:uncharacterized membrane protein (DUF4010 family)
MTEIEIFLRLLLALSLGMIIGSEREKFAKKDNDYEFGGIRTFMFIALLGALSGLISKEYFGWIIVPVFIGLVSLLAVGYHYSIKLTKGRSIGVTGEIAALLTFLIGLLALTDYVLLSIAMAILIATFLYLKVYLHGFLKRVNEKEMYSTFIFAIIAFVILPFLPNQAYGPYGVFNPYRIWLMVVFIAGLSYVGYILTKILGSKKGIGLTGFFGGLASSTAVTMSMASRSKEEKNAKFAKMFIFATLVASSVMYVRVLILVLVLNRALLNTLLLPMLVMGVVTIICAGFFWFKKDGESQKNNAEIRYESPLSVSFAIKFGLFFALVLFVIKVAQTYLGHTGLYIASVLSGFVDVDAITLSMTGIAGSDVGFKVAATAITLAVMSNTFVKIVYARIFGSREFAKKLAITLAIVIVAGLLTIWLL